MTVWPHLDTWPYNADTIKGILFNVKRENGKHTWISQCNICKDPDLQEEITLRHERRVQITTPSADDNRT